MNMQQQVQEQKHMPEVIVIEQPANDTSVLWWGTVVVPLFLGWLQYKRWKADKDG